VTWRGQSVSMSQNPLNRAGKERRVLEYRRWKRYMRNMSQYESKYTKPEPMFPDTPIDPQGKSRGFVTFAVPQNTQAADLQFEVSEGKALIKLQ